MSQMSNSNNSNNKKRNANYNQKLREVTDDIADDSYLNRSHFNTETFQSQRSKIKDKTGMTVKNQENPEISKSQIKFVWTSMPEEVKKCKEEMLNITNNKTNNNTNLFSNPDNYKNEPITTNFFNPKVETNFLNLSKSKSLTNTNNSNVSNDSNVLKNGNVENNNATNQKLNNNNFITREVNQETNNETSNGINNNIFENPFKKLGQIVLPTVQVFQAVQGNTSNLTNIQTETPIKDAKSKSSFQVKTNKFSESQSKSSGSKISKEDVNIVNNKEINNNNIENNSNSNAKSLNSNHNYNSTNSINVNKNIFNTEESKPKPYKIALEYDLSKSALNSLSKKNINLANNVTAVNNNTDNNINYNSKQISNKSKKEFEQQQEKEQEIVVASLRKTHLISQQEIPALNISENKTESRQDSNFQINTNFNNTNNGELNKEKTPTITTITTSSSNTNENISENKPLNYNPFQKKVEPNSNNSYNPFLPKNTNNPFNNSNNNNNSTNTHINAPINLFASTSNNPNTNIFANLSNQIKTTTNATTFNKTNTNKTNGFSFNFNQNRETEDNESSDEGGEENINPEQEIIDESITDKPKIELGKIEKSQFEKVYSNTVSAFSMYNKEEKKYHSLGNGNISLEKFIGDEKKDWIYMIFRNNYGVTLFKGKILINKSKVEKLVKNFNSIALVNCLQEAIKRVGDKEVIDILPKITKINFLNESNLNMFMDRYNEIRKEVESVFGK